MVSISAWSSTRNVVHDDARPATILHQCIWHNEMQYGNFCQGKWMITGQIWNGFSWFKGKSKFMSFAGTQLDIFWIYVDAKLWSIVSEDLLPVGQNRNADTVMGNLVFENIYLHLFYPLKIKNVGRYIELCATNDFVVTWIVLLDAVESTVDRFCLVFKYVFQKYHLFWLVN